MDRYANARSFRVALEQRLKQRASNTGMALDRLRKEVAFQRLLARLEKVGQPDSWALKGGLALIARLDGNTRATRDVDATWRQSSRELEDWLEAAVEQDLHDHFEFEIGTPKAMTAEGPEGGCRYPVVARLDGREFERLQLDVNLFPNDPRPVETVLLRNLLSFAGLEAPSVPVVRIEQHLAEKLHAYTRNYEDRTNSRAKDMFDMLIIADRIELPSAQMVVSACQQTFTLRSTEWPPVLESPPALWAGAWSGFVRDYALSWTDLERAYGRSHVVLGAYFRTRGGAGLGPKRMAVA